MLLWTPRAPGMHVVHGHTCTQNTHAHKIKVNTSLNLSLNDQKKKSLDLLTS